MAYCLYYLVELSIKLSKTKIKNIENVFRCTFISDPDINSVRVPLSSMYSEVYDTLGIDSDMEPCT